jgi:hypothetical protein
MDVISTLILIFCFEAIVAIFKPDLDVPLWQHVWEGSIAILFMFGLVIFIRAIAIDMYTGWHRHVRLVYACTVIAVVVTLFLRSTNSLFIGSAKTWGEFCSLHVHVFMQSALGLWGIFVVATHN